MPHAIRIGIGGWSFPPWRETFYPKDVSAKKELAYASSKLTAIEINSTFYRNQTPATFRKWAAETPENFMFAVKAQRFAMMRKTPEDMKESIQTFLESGVTELGAKLGPINWQFPATRKFDPDYFEAFCKSLPAKHGRARLRHAIEVRHASFSDPALHDLLRKHGHALVFADEPNWSTPDVETADFAYARLQCSDAIVKTGYKPAALTRWAKTFSDWASKRNVFGFFISGAKERNPAAAMALIAKLTSDN